MSQSAPVLAAIVDQRFANQCLTRARHRTAADLVAWFGAVQAQEYGPAKWGLGLRLPGKTRDADVERELTDGRILRTHVLRPTWHFVAAADIRWMQELTAPRVHRAMAPYRRNYELSPATLTRATTLIERALGECDRTRKELRDMLARAGIRLNPSQMAHTCMYAELEAIICSGPRRGKEAPYALVAKRSPRALRLSRDEALAELVKRYFRSHGPATVADLSWWSGLNGADAKRGLEINGAKSETIDGLTYWRVGPTRRASGRLGSVHLLPIYDEYLVAYRSRVAVPHAPPPNRGHAKEFVTFQHAIVVDGLVAGTWRTAGKRPGEVEMFPMRRLNSAERRGTADAIGRYQRFLTSPTPHER